MRLDEKLTFSTIDCVGCGSRRVQELACGECGRAPRPGEVNPPVVRRRQAVAKVTSLVEAPITFDGSLTNDAILDELRGLPTKFFSSLASLLRENGSDLAARELAATIQANEQLALLLEARAQLRPTSMARACLRVTIELAKVWPLYLEAVTVADISLTQTLAGRGQQVLDNSTAQLVALSRVYEAAEMLTTARSELSIVERAFEALSSLYPDADLAQLMRIGVDQGQRIGSAAVAPGSAIDLLVVDLVAKAYLDSDALDVKLHELRGLGQDQERLLDAAQLPGALRDLGIARRDIFESLIHFERIIKVESDPDAVFRRLSKTVGELYEASLPLLAWGRILTAETTAEGQYARLVKMDATSHVEHLAREMPRTFADMPSFLRHSAHHGRAVDIDSATQVIEVSLRSFGATFTVPEYIDKAYALLESVLALNWTLSNALERRGVNVQLPEGTAMQIGLTTEKTAALWLSRFRGISVIESVRHDRQWRVEAEFSAQETLTTALSLATSAALDYESISVVRAGSHAPPLSLALSAYQQYADRSADASREDTALELVEFLHSMTRGDACLLTTADLEFAIVCCAFATIEGDLSHVRRLRRLRELALGHGATALAEVAASALATIRNGTNWKLKAELARRTQLFKAPQLPGAESVEVWLRRRPPIPTRPCD